MFQLGLRDNDLLDIPREIGELTRLRELHIQNNRLTVLPPEVGFLDLQSNKSVLKMEENEWVQPIMEQYLLGISHVLEYIKSEAYRMYEGTFLIFSKMFVMIVKTLCFQNV